MLILVQCFPSCLYYAIKLAVFCSSVHSFFVFFLCVQEMSNKEIDLTYKLKVLQQELEQEEASHKATRALLADKSKIKVTIEGAKSESMKGKEHQLCLYLLASTFCYCWF